MYSTKSQITWARQYFCMFIWQFQKMCSISQRSNVQMGNLWVWLTFWLSCILGVDSQYKEGTVGPLCNSAYPPSLMHLTGQSNGGTVKSAFLSHHLLFIMRKPVSICIKHRSIKHRSMHVNEFHIELHKTGIQYRNLSMRKHTLASNCIHSKEISRQ